MFGRGSGGTRPALLAVLALVVAGLVVGGSSATGAVKKLITSAQIKDGTITAKDIKDKAITAKDIKPKTLPPSVLTPTAVNQFNKPGPTGPKGPPGPLGPTGPKGPPGPPAAANVTRQAIGTGVTTQIADLGSVATISATCTGAALTNGVTLTVASVALVAPETLVVIDGRAQSTQQITSGDNLGASQTLDAVFNPSAVANAAMTAHITVSRGPIHIEVDVDALTRFNNVGGCEVVRRIIT